MKTRRIAGTVLLTLLATLFLSSIEARRQTSCLVATPNGIVQGIDNGVSCSFLADNVECHCRRGLSAGQPRGEHDRHGQRELPEVERLDAGSGACVVGTGHSLDSHRRLHGGFAERR